MRNGRFFSGKIKSTKQWISTRNWVARVKNMSYRLLKNRSRLHSWFHFCVTWLDFHRSVKGRFRASGVFFASCSPISWALTWSSHSSHESLGPVLLPRSRQVTKAFWGWVCTTWCERCILCWKEQEQVCLAHPPGLLEKSWPSLQINRSQSSFVKIIANQVFPVIEGRHAFMGRWINSGIDWGKYVIFLF